MRHYYSYDAAGNIVGQHTHSSNVTGLGGWPDGFDLHDADVEHEVASELRANFMRGDPRIVGFVLYDCDCSPTESVCGCVSGDRNMFRVNTTTKQLVEKKIGSLIVAGAPVEQGATIVRPPGTVLKARIAAVGVADAEKIYVYPRGNPSIVNTDSRLELTFTSGMTEEFDLVAPPQGFTGMAITDAIDVQPIRVSLRGWAS